MKTLWIVLAIIIFMAIVVSVINYLSGDKLDIFPYQKKKYFMSLSERKFFEILTGILNNQYYIFPQVYVASIVEVRKGQEHYMSYLNKINRKSFDFVIFDKMNWDVILVIELDDRSHERADRIERDNFVNGVLKVSDLKILHVKPQDNYNLEELSKLIQVSINPVISNTKINSEIVS